MKHIVIMAGGAGKRLWPASIAKQPKQLMELSEGKSLLLTTIERGLSIDSDGTILIITHQSQIEGCINACSKLQKTDRERIVILGEPEARNTAPALALAAQWIILNHSPKDSMLVMAADHIITPIDKFRENAATAYSEADNKKLVTFGIKPDYPSTGYGYVEASVEKKPVRKVLSFKEKPNQEKAEDFIIKGNYFWNSGMFAYRADQFFLEMNQFQPEISLLFGSLKVDDFSISSMTDIRYSKAESNFCSIYGKSPSISIDYALMEKSSNLSMVVSVFKWNDVGSWDSLADESLTDESLVFGNINENYIFSDLPVAIKGVDNLIVVVKNGKVLICPRGESQVVKSLVEEIQEKGHQDLL